MDIKVKKKEHPLLMAVYLPSEGGQLCLFSGADTHIRLWNGAWSTYTGTLQNTLDKNSGAIPIREGDEVTITF